MQWLTNVFSYPEHLNLVVLSAKHLEKLPSPFAIVRNKNNIGSG
jgi:hypothetical protein